MLKNKSYLSRSQIFFSFLLLYTLPLGAFFWFLYVEVSGIFQKEYNNALLNFAREIDNEIDVDFLRQGELRKEIQSQEKKIFPFSLKDAYVLVKNSQGAVLAYNGALRVPEIVRELEPGELEEFQALGPGSYKIHRLSFGGGDFYQIDYFGIDRNINEYFIQILVSASYLKADKEIILNKIAIFLPLLLIVATGIAYFFFRVSLRPIKKLSRELSKSKSLNFKTDLEVQPGIPNELKEFIKQINLLIDKTTQSLKDQELFIAFASHQIKTPLTVLSGYAQDLFKNASTQYEKEIGSAIHSSAQELNKITEKLLVLNSLSGRDQRGQISEVDALEEILFCLESREREIQDKTLKLMFDFQNGDNCKVLSDRELFNTLIDNLISNAVKYTPEGGSIRISCERGLQGQVFVAIRNEVKDARAVDVKKIFKPFYRAPGAAEKAEGSGLGLYLAKRVSEVLDAEIAAVSDGEYFEVNFKIKSF